MSTHDIIENKTNTGETSLVSPLALCQIEIYVEDVARALDFYREVFGWHVLPAEMHNYFILQVPRDCPYGIAIVPRAASSTEAATQPNSSIQSESTFKAQPANLSNSVLYFKTASIEPIKLRIEPAGGRILGQRRIPGYGQLLQFCDPENQRWGVYENPSKTP